MLAQDVHYRKDGSNQNTVQSPFCTAHQSLEMTSQERLCPSGRNSKELLLKDRADKPHDSCCYRAFIRESKPTTSARKICREHLVAQEHNGQSTFLILVSFANHSLDQFCTNSLCSSPVSSFAIFLANQLANRLRCVSTEKSVSWN